MKLVWFLLLLHLVLGYQRINNEQTQALIKKHPSSQFLDKNDPKGYLQPILQTRVPGSKGSSKVRSHFESFFETLDEWSLELDHFKANTPVGQNVSFTNVIATKDPPGEVSSRLVVAAHYDSKLEPHGFIGAIDSAVPCAIIMHAVKSIDKFLTQKWQSTLEKASTGLQVIFFDGEEAFKEWSDTDSIYGARHLASKLEGSELKQIRTLVLLDLIGSPSPRIPSFFENTDKLHQKLGKIDTRLTKLGLSKRSDKIPFFIGQPHFHLGGLYGDDHMPFLQRNVRVLHLIPVEFPPVWHKITDDAEHLDMNSVYDFADIFTVFLAEYFALGPLLGREKSYL